MVSAALLVSSHGALADFVQQGPKLLGTVEVASQGWSVALSADGNTAIVGAPSDNGSIGAAWIFTRSGGTWTRQDKLVGSGAVGRAEQGASVALSAAGNIAIVGGPDDNGGVGAAWVFTRRFDGVWIQGSKLVGDGAVGNANQGGSVALSADGYTALVGGRTDNDRTGATWVFTGGVQRGPKLVGRPGVAGDREQGRRVALSADGNTALIGGHNDQNGTAPAWVFIRIAGDFVQQSGTLVGGGPTGSSPQGASVALSGDGNTALVGDSGDNQSTGAAWVFTRAVGVWSPQGDKLVGFGATGPVVAQGWSVALSADGNTALVGGLRDNGGAGAAWVFRRTGRSWTQQGSKLVGIGAVGTGVEQGASVALSADGNTAIIGGPRDNDYAGAAWVFGIARSIAAGGYHTCAVTTAGGAKCWGDNNSGELGNGSNTKSPVPVDVTGLIGGVAAVAAGLAHNCAVTSAGGVKCWGAGQAGQLGNGSYAGSPFPVDVTGLTSGVAIAAGDWHTCALTGAGGVKCWGSNSQGQLGIGSSDPPRSYVPLDVSGLTSGVVGIAAGGTSTCALLNTGGVQCWGANGSGQLGNGNYTDSYRPVDVSGLTSGAASVAVGGLSVCALASTGGLKCWGSNAFGELGIGSFDPLKSNVPLDNRLTYGVTSVAGGFRHICALNSPGGAKTWCWGSNIEGQLGIGTFPPNGKAPLDVPGAGGAVAITGGYDHTCALMSSPHAAKCWGRGLEGQLGNGENRTSYAPVDVSGL